MAETYPELLSWISDTDDLWQVDAACKDADLSIFFEGNRAGGWTKALKICATCTVVDECRSYNEAYERAVGWRSGVYGNTTAPQRNKEFPLADEDK